MQKLAKGFLINDKIVAIVEQGGELVSDKDVIKPISICIDKECIEQWHEELQLGIKDDWEETEKYMEGF